MSPIRPLQTDRRTALYRFFDRDDALLYIGITVNPKARDYQHAAKSPWWPQAARKEVCWYPTWVEADAAEGTAIRSEQPRYNIAGNRTPAARPPSPPSRPRLEPDVARRLRVTADTARRARAELLEAMVEATQGGATNLDIAKEIDFFYNPDYIGKLLAKKVGKRPPGRRPGRPARTERAEQPAPAAPAEDEQPES